jgi:hypothetical protein
MLSLPGEHSQLSRFPGHLSTLECTRDGFARGAAASAKQKSTWDQFTGMANGVEVSYVRAYSGRTGIDRTDSPLSIAQTGRIDRRRSRVMITLIVPENKLSTARRSDRPRTAPASGSLPTEWREQRAARYSDTRVSNSAPAAAVSLTSRGSSICCTHHKRRQRHAHTRHSIILCRPRCCDPPVGSDKCTLICA